MPGENSLYVGVEHAVITPPVGTELSGYGFYLNRKAYAIENHLYAQALVLEQGRNRAALLTADLLAVSPEILARTRALIAEATAIPEDNILIACSHTHSGPAVFFLHGCGEVDTEYTALLPRLLASAAIEAARATEPAEVRYGQMELHGLARNRVDPQGAVDTTLQTLEFLHDESDQAEALFAFSCHPVTTLGSNAGVHPDFPGVARDILEGLDRYNNALFLQGSCGDINPVMAHTNLSETRRGGQMLAGAALLALAQGREVAQLAPLQCLRRQIELPLVIPERADLEALRAESLAKQNAPNLNLSDQRTARFQAEAAAALLQHLDSGTAAETLPCEIQAIRIGDIVFLAHPTELFAEFGIEIRERSPFPHTFVVGYANGFLGYIPNEADFARQGYAAATVPYMLHRFPYRPDVGRVFVEACVQLLNDLRER
jgi:hypothetical protein